MLTFKALGRDGTDYADGETVAIRVGPQGVTVEQDDGSTHFVAEGELEIRVSGIEDSGLV